MEFPRSIIAFEKSNMFSVFIPNCPAASATADISVVEEGISFAMSLMPCFNSSICSFVPSTVFSTPAKASSKSIALLALKVKADILAAENAEEGEEVVYYLTGEFFGSAIEVPVGKTAADFKAPFRKIGIFLVDTDNATA